MRHDFVYVGQVLRVTFTKWGNDIESHDPPIWAIATDSDNMDAGVYVDWLIGQPKSGQGVIDWADHYTIPSESEWPDAVCVEMAKRRLL